MAVALKKFRRSALTKTISVEPAPKQELNWAMFGQTLIGKKFVDDEGETVLKAVFVSSTLPEVTGYDPQGIIKAAMRDRGISDPAQTNVQSFNDEDKLVWNLNESHAELSSDSLDMFHDFTSTVKGLIRARYVPGTNHTTDHYLNVLLPNMMKQRGVFTSTMAQILSTPERVTSSAFNVDLGGIFLQEMIVKKGVIEAPTPSGEIGVLTLELAIGDDQKRAMQALIDLLNRAYGNSSKSISGYQIDGTFYVSMCGQVAYKTLQNMSGGQMQMMQSVQHGGAVGSVSSAGGSSTSGSGGDVGTNNNGSTTCSKCGKGHNTVQYVCSCGNRNHAK